MTIFYGSPIVSRGMYAIGSAPMFSGDSLLQ